jgi:hypothetical protein
MAQQEVDRIINSELSLLSKYDLMYFLFHPTKFAKNKNRRNKMVIVQCHLGAIGSCLRQFSTFKWSGKDILLMINSLQLAQDNDMGVNEFLVLLTSIISRFLNSKSTLTTQGIAMILYELKGMHSSCSGLRASLKVIALNFIHCNEIFDGQAVGNAFYGVQGMSSDSAEVRDMLSALVLKVKSWQEDLGVQAVGNAFYGVQGMSSDRAEVRDMLSALVLKVKSCKVALGAQAVGNALHGMQGMGGANEYQTLLDFLYNKTESIVGSALLCETLSCKDLVYFGQHLALTLTQEREVLKEKRW